MPCIFFLGPCDICHLTKFCGIISQLGALALIIIDALIFFNKSKNLKHFLQGFYRYFRLNIALFQRVSFRIIFPTIDTKEASYHLSERNGRCCYAVCLQQVIFEFIQSLCSLYFIVRVADSHFGRYFCTSAKIIYSVAKVVMSCSP